MSKLINIFLEPTKVFAELKEKPTFWLPLLLIMGLSAIMVLLYFGKVDPDWYIDHMLQASGKAMSASEMAQAKKVMPGARVLGYIGAPSAIVGVAFMSALFALYYMLAGKVTGNSTSFVRGLTLVSWSGMPALLGTVVAIIGVLTMSPQTGLESLNLTHFDPLFVQLPPTNPWSTLAKSFSLLSLWSIFLAALGWRVWGNTSWTQAISVAALPNLVIYGGMAIFAALK